MTGGLDLHCHVLPGIDDGAPDSAASLAMLRQAAEGGTECVVATPHQHPGRYPNDDATIHAAFERLTDAIEGSPDAASLPRVLLGAEVHLDERLPERLADGELLPLASSRRVLLELPDLVSWRGVEQAVFDLRVAGYEPVLAHPERCGGIVREPDRLGRMLELGCLTQLTGSSIAGDFGEPCRALSEDFLRRGWIHVIASDAHDLVRRTCDLSRARAAVSELVGADEARRLFEDAPRAVVSGEPVHAPRPAPRDDDGPRGGRPAWRRWLDGLRR